MILSLFDYSGEMVRPWLEAGIDAWIVDWQHEPGIHETKYHTGATLTREGADLLTWVPPKHIINEVAFVAAFPPCDELAVSGARWFPDESRGKGLPGLVGALRLVQTARFWCQWFGVPAFFENPVSTISSYYRKPDFTFNPKDYTGWCDQDNYVKKTCLWAYNGFELPEENVDPDAGEPDERIWRAGPSPERKNFRSKTPLGFAKAVRNIYAS